MPSTDLHATATTEEAERVLRVCSACMYCDGFCAVFPAIAGRSAFSLADIAHLANLCHACRGCWYACQYAPPHPFAVNLPQTLAATRLETYAAFSRPRVLAGAFARNGTTVAAIVGSTTLAALTTVLLAVPGDDLFAVHTGEGAFYRVIPWGLMSAAAGLSLLWAGVAIGASTRAFWRAIGPTVKSATMRRAVVPAVRDIVTLENLGEPPGCNDVGEKFSRERRISHHVLVVGVLLSLVSTLSAGIWHHVFEVEAPYAFTSLPVIAGTVGGVLILGATAGLLAVETRVDRAPVAAPEARLNVVFLVLLALVAATGLAVLALRGTALMGLTLTLHLGVVTGFFLALPASKLLHAPFRAAALFRAAIDRLVSPPRRSTGE